MANILPPATPTLRARLETLLERESKIGAEIRELRLLLGDAAKVHKTPTGRRSRHDVPECGTESAYQRHRHYGDTASETRRVTCVPCLEGHAAHNRLGAA